MKRDNLDLQPIRYYQTHHISLVHKNNNAYRMPWNK